MVWINQGRWRATSSFLLDYRAKRGKTHEISDELVLGLVVKIVIIITLFSLCTFSKMHFLTLLLDNIALAELLVITCVIISHSYFYFLNPTSPKIHLNLSYFTVVFSLQNQDITWNMWCLDIWIKALLWWWVKGKWKKFCYQAVRDNHTWSDGQVICYSLFVPIFLAEDRSVDVRL